MASFSLLESDLTARVNPVFDLNGDACALIKVIGDSRFDFSGPLGIVKRTERTAEILLYVPAGTKEKYQAAAGWKRLLHCRQNWQILKRMCPMMIRSKKGKRSMNRK